MTGWLLAAYLASFGGDLVTTHVALARGGREVVLTQSPWVNDGVLAGEAAAGLWALHRLQPAHPQLARVVAGVAISAHSSAAFVNVRWGMVRSQ